jgi:hypothetical protein
MEGAAAPRGLLLVKKVHQAKVHELGQDRGPLLARGGRQQDNVLRLDIVVQEAASVNVVQSTTELSQNFAEDGADLGRSVIGQILSIKVFQGQKGLSRSVQDSVVEHTGEIRMPQPGHGAEFLLESFLAFPGKERFAEGLQGEKLLAVEEIFHQEDLPHSTFPERTEDAVAVVKNDAGLGQGASPCWVSLGDSVGKSTTIVEPDQVLS